MDGSDDLQAAIAALWRDARPRTLGRVETLEDAVAALAAGALDPELADRARQDAHKLAGSLGTFGMPEGSERARTLEARLGDGAERDEASALSDHVRALRRIVEAGPA